MAYDQAPHTGEYNPFYQGYVSRVPAGDIVAILATQIDDTTALLRELTDEQAGFAYAPQKWTIKQVIGHLTDAERVFAYRALRFARADQTPLATFDENLYAGNAASDQRPLASLIAEMNAVRRATVALLAHLPEEAFTRGGPASGMFVSVRALAWIIAGHELHHRAILAERYIDNPALRRASPSAS
jgi:uncharacterized damage-inducible protein DinB